MNLFDLCAVCVRGIGKAICRVAEWIGSAIRLSFRKWWIVLPMLAFAVGFACYYSRLDNRIYKMNAVAILNGPSVELFGYAYQPLVSVAVSPDSPMFPYLADKQAMRFASFPVIDCLNDNTADYVDFKLKSKLTDTLNVHMKDRVCLQFRLKEKDMALLPDIENAILAQLNGDERLQAAYAAYMPTLDREVQFCHDQVEKLDSLTSAFYFDANPSQQLKYTYRDGGLFLGDRRIKLFLGDIQKHFEHTRMIDQKKMMATAPVVLENHFVKDLAPVNSPIKSIVLFGFVGWLIGCLIALCVEQRKTICAWLKKNE